MRSSSTKNKLVVGAVGKYSTARTKHAQQQQQWQAHDCMIDALDVSSWQSGCNTAGGAPPMQCCSCFGVAGLIVNTRASHLSAKYMCCEMCDRR
jgi:hypothetical protein